MAFAVRTCTKRAELVVGRGAVVTGFTLAVVSARQVDAY